MSFDFVNIHGTRFIPTADTKKQARSKKEAQTEFHKGFRVEGHPPGALEAARDEALMECAAWERLPERQKQAGRPPKPWDETVWRKRTKPKPVRSKPYELPQAADQCAELARKAGWLDVRVVELKREKA